MNQMSVERMTLGTGQYVQEMIVEGVTPGTVCKRGLWRVGELAVCAGEECVGYNSRHYVQQESVKGMTVGIMCRRGVWKVRHQEAYAKEEYGGDNSRQYMQESNVEGVTAGVGVGSLLH